MTESDLRQQICLIGQRMYDSGFVAANDGNISVKLDDNEILTTPTGVSKGFMTPEMLLKVNSEGSVLTEAGSWRPSSELKMHLRVYQDRPDVGAVVHAHPPYATTFAVAHIPLNKPLIAEAVVNLGCVPVAEYGTPSTQEVPAAVARYLEHFDAVLLANHGALAWGEDLVTAYHKLESVEYYAKLMFLSKQLGEAQELSESQFETLLKIREKMGLTGRHPGKCRDVECDFPCARKTRS
ncbi:class II aldolase/adducin family protein [Sporomusa acidovorans]|uniref:5-deoxy-D-ribulose 1-phosphate aldolase n=1 Tax=Sporomusa acidovorans (strain ATCC 49682 / DSM 3132 / Mol) TaxID=1123286 RepID=A0ABZ3J135_SPOA4|nr:class II aldolase/adducin family protein [Sporomusa acidovorans]OZC22849.1 L-fuculose phosphate aldolase [Sporomusa acidovorans DSM 3132]SDE52923.1 L-fuculose-phosphate aldolase [Sporomusa acidovorans]